MYRCPVYFITFFLILTGVLAAAEQRAILELRINEVQKGELTVLLREVDVLAPLRDLEVAGLKSLRGSREKIGGDSYVLLSTLAPEITFSIDEKDLSLRLTAPPSMLGYNLIEPQSGKPTDITYGEGSSGFVNYAINLRDFKHTDVFSEIGINVKNGLLYSGIAKNQDGGFVRGLSNLTLSNRESLIRTIVGDRLVSSDILGGSVVMGGVSYFREFALDPYFVRNPGFNYSGAVSTPSTVDVYVNGQLLRRVPLPPGQFDLRDLPVPAGAGDTRLVLRDAFGREQEIGSQYYFSAGLLKPGLHEFSYNFGSLRNNLATQSWDYGPLIFLGRHRLGINDSLTAGLRLEASEEVMSGGPSVSFRLPLGEVEFATAVSGSHGLAGGATFFGYHYLGKLFNLGGSIRLMSPQYATTSLKASDERSWMQFNALTGLSVSSRLGVSLRYTLENSKLDGLSHRISMSTSTRVSDRVSLFVTGTHSRQATGVSNGVFAGLTFLFGHTTGSLSYENLGGVGVETAVLQKSLPIGSGFGYRLQASTGQDQNFSVDSQLQYQNQYGRYEASYNRLAGQDSTVLSASGGLAVIGRDFYLTRPVQESFAVIRVPGVDGVRGYASNQEVGYTNTKGNLFVPNLLSYYGNKLSISDKDIPLNYTIAATQRVIAPPFRGGVLVTFPVQRIQRATGVVNIVSAETIEIPTFGQLTIDVNGKQLESPIGRQGEFYLENLPTGRHQAIINYQGNACSFTLAMPQSDEPLVQLGTIQCEM